MSPSSSPSSLYTALSRACSSSMQTISWPESRPTQSLKRHSLLHFYAYGIINSPIFHRRPVRKRGLLRQTPPSTAPLTTTPTSAFSMASASSSSSSSSLSLGRSSRGRTQTGEKGKGKTIGQKEVEAKMVRTKMGKLRYFDNGRFSRLQPHMGKGGDPPPLRVKNPPPTLRPKIGYLQRTFLMIPPSEAKIEAFLTKFC